jgi:hypothetical protein
MEFWPLKTLSEVLGLLLGLQLSPTPDMGVHLGVWGFTPSHSLDSLHSREHVMWLPGLLLGPQPCNLLALVASQMLGLRHARLRAKRKPESHVTYSQECRKVWGSEPSYSQNNSHFGRWSPDELPKLQRTIWGVKTQWLMEFFISLKFFWNVNV